MGLFSSSTRKSSKTVSISTMSEPLKIRNFTNSPLELKLVERYEIANPLAAAPQGLGNFTRNITSFVSNATSGAIPNPTKRELAENAESFARQDVNIRVDPFTTAHTDIRPTERGPDEITRLTFENDGQRYRIDAPTPSNSSATFVPLGGAAHKQFTGIYLPSQSFLAVYSSSDLSSWMGHLNDRTPISALSIPGTHNSPTCHKALPSVRCQAVGIRAQLDNGVRFFDIRVQPESPDDPGRDGLILVHGVFPISLTGNKYLRDLVNETRSFLDANPSETVIMSIKREGPGTHNDAQLSMILKDHYARPGDDKWYTEPRLPTLGEVRGKIVVMRRFALDDRLRGEWGGRGIYIDAENWAYNTPNDRHGDVCVQDFCEVLETENIDQKIRVCCEHLDRSSGEECNMDEARGGPLYLNFLSASNFWKVGCWPDRIAAKVNPAVIGHLAMNHDKDNRGDGSAGVVVCDWVGDNGDWDLVRCIVGMNARLSSKHPR
ncbi:hypothetical protein KVT40_005573 [Elsinoe batatas]|uniref:Phosphatidylinositol-specific phospholipase C X domain-containing protein n=1 Tax=Elsinoe batatas TaxID=2601811 RepID=A0A8K0L1T9_9PEZI|nr:hypothetical protein KVT40_005573 [Elsinoe batatas]